jgi:Peptidase family M23
MRLPRTTARIILPAATLALVASAGVHKSRAAVASSAPPARIVFPVVGKATFSDDFGDPRPGGPHQGNDMIAARHTPVVAAEAGTVRLWTRSASAGCMLYLHGRSGTTYLYIHLNNDLGAKNDNQGRCVDGVAYAPGLRDGQKVAAGALLGFVGDSGDANGAHPHLHFELHPGGGRAVSPYRWLKRARHLLYPGATRRASVAPFAIKLTGTVLAVSSGSDTTDGSLKIAVRRVKLPGLKAVAPGRSVVLDVPETATIDEGGGGTPISVPLDYGAKGDPVVAWSTIDAPGLRSELAQPGTIAADRLLYDPS